VRQQSTRTANVELECAWPSWLIPPGQVSALVRCPAAAIADTMEMRIALAFSFDRALMLRDASRARPPAISVKRARNNQTLAKLG